ncbi:Charged multivesicular body protein 6 [Trichoplax sp. H2]|nr:Charged multivesicular body protein 6 [Trichoplax sp. H2]|eukprot:RDD38142.1 Charged multivesicular body protein 6 [Trichoplax sp. H2]
MVNDVEFAKIQVQVVERLKQGNECLDRMHKMMSIEDVERIMDETQEAIEYQKQIDELLGNTLTDEDETAVLAELEQITQQELQNLPDVPAASLPATTTEDVELPDVPTEDPGVKRKAPAPLLAS